jgi:hypothetical protein
VVEEEALSQGMHGEEEEEGNNEKKVDEKSTKKSGWNDGIDG